MSERNQYVDALKGYAILLVVIGHAIQRTAGFGYWPFQEMSPYVPFSGYVTMPLFFVVSGFLLYGRVRKPLLPWLGIKTRQILLPWASWTLLYYFVIRDKFVPTAYSLPGYLRSQILNPSLWYLTVLSMCYVVLALGFGIDDWSLPLLGVAIVLVPWPRLVQLQWFWWWFILGYFIGRFQGRVVPLRFAGWVSGLALYVAGMVLLGQNVDLGARAAMALGAGLTGTLATWLLCKTPLMRPLAYMGVHSLEIYVGQFLFVQLLVIKSPANALITTILAIVGSLAIGYLLRKNRWTDLVFLGARTLHSARAVSTEGAAQS